uniref:Purinergic receptor n=1 Tax=Arcella intermedia TaxID=1963864 RepID=A0A6B2L8U6_9EUKA
MMTIKVNRIGYFHRSIQFVVVLYATVYVLWYAQGYQDYDNARGVFYVKVKGYGQTEGGVVYDAADIVVPPLEPESVFITTALVRTIQQRDICVSSSKCVNDSGCVSLESTEGLILSTCNKTSPITSTGYCLMNGWCPAENDSVSGTDYLHHLDNVSLFIRSSGNYLAFDYSFSDPLNPVPGRNLFYFKDLFKGTQFTQDNCTKLGCIITLNIDWTCDLNKGNCLPTYKFYGTNLGFNYREIIYHNSTTRELTKIYGLKLLVTVSGVGGKFSFFRLVIALGSNLALVTACTLITDLILLAWFRGTLQQRKYDHFGGEATNPQTDNPKPMSY